MRPVLVVADDPELTHLIVTILEHGGYDPVAADTRQQALLAVRRDHPLAVLVDVNMRHQSGVKFLHDCQTDPDCRHVPSAALAADVDEIQDASVLGARERLLKPFGVTAVLQLVDRLTGTPRSPASLPAN